jgi:putative inorganic carbon (HCO3(-)) transporter
MVGAISLSTIAIAPLRVRVLSIFGTADSSNAFRVNVWMSVKRMIDTRPFLGIGPGNKAFNLIYPIYQRSGYSALGAYSVPLELTVETGYIGVICYGWLVVTIFIQGWQTLNRLRSDRHGDGLFVIGAIASLSGMLAHGLFDTVWYRPQVQLLWWLAIALIGSLYSNSPANEPQE